MSATLAANPFVRDALREFEDDLERARGNLEKALADATRKAFSQPSFERTFMLAEGEKPGTLVETAADDNEDEDDETLIIRAEERADDLIAATLKDYDWEFDQAMRRLKARLGR
jgi:hypothetical protein